jgi:tRNA ligase
MYRTLKQSKRIQPEFHVTLIHRASAAQKPEVWQMYTEEFTKALGSKDLKDKNQLAASLGPARVKLERLVWDDRVMVFVVRVFPTPGGPTWPSANPITHITVGTARQDIKPVESNELLSRWEAGETTGASIHEKEVPGAIVLDGSVKPVFQRNFVSGK